MVRQTKTSSQRQSCGRKQLVDERLKKNVKNRAPYRQTTNRQITVRNCISESTICRSLSWMGYYSRWPHRVPLLPAKKQEAAWGYGPILPGVNGAGWWRWCNIVWNVFLGHFRSLVTPDLSVLSLTLTVLITNKPVDCRHAWSKYIVDYGHTWSKYRIMLSFLRVKFQEEDGKWFGRKWLGHLCNKNRLDAMEFAKQHHCPWTVFVWYLYSTFTKMKIL